MKKVLGLFIILCFFGTNIVLGESAAASSYAENYEKNDIAHQIWKAMAEAGNKDMTKAWELQGMYTFGETTGDGYITLFLDESGRIKGDISFRCNPQSLEDVNVFFTMHKVLLSELGYTGKNDTFDLLPFVIYQAMYKHVTLPKSDFRFSWSGRTITSSLEYDADYNELYTLISGDFLY